MRETLRLVNIFPTAGLVKAASLVKLVALAQRATYAHVFFGD